MDCGLDGLSADDAARRRERYGPNRLPETPPRPGWRIFLRQFLSPLIYILLVAAGISVALGMLDDAGFILGVLLLNAMIGTAQESRAEREIRSLGKLLVVKARVQRGGHTRELPSEELVPGDVVWLESGVRVGADMRLLEAHGLRVDQSLLTGESMPVEKLPRAALPEPLPPSDQANMVFSGSTVFQGRARALVVGTGLRSQVGLIARGLERQAAMKPPLLIRMEHFTRVIALTIGGLCVVVFGVGLLRGTPWPAMLMAALALSVSAIPEGLPVALTVALALGVKRMARRNVLVRRLEAVEGLGSCSVIGSDKTGTLTENQLTVVAGTLAGEGFDVTGGGYVPEGEVRCGRVTLHAEQHPLLYRLVRAGALCNEATLAQEDSAWAWQGDPMDVALLALAIKAGAEPGTLQEHHPGTNAIPFEPERRFAASYHQSEGGGLVLVKGAPERVLAMCDTQWNAEATERLPLVPDTVHGWVRDLALQGYRVMALAEREEPQPLRGDATPPEPAGLTLIGLVGMTDPPRAGVAEAVAACRRAGIRVVMITGDHLDTAWIIAQRVGIVAPGDALAGDNAIDGAALDALAPDELRRRVGRLAVVGRATPTAKLNVVRALQESREFVAVTGDGVNDAPALRAAHIGVAMGRAGTDVAREAAELVITDDDFSSIVAGVEEGRIAYENVRKVIYLLVSTGLGEVLVVLATLLAGLPVPFLPAQLLWLNLVTNGIQDVALAFEPGEAGILRRPPRPPREPIFNRLMLERTLLACSVFGGVGFAWYTWLLRQGTPVDEARALLLNLFVVFEMFHAGNSRSEVRSLLLLNPLANPLLFLGTLSAMGVHLAALHVPYMQAVLRAAPLSLGQWGTLALFGASILLVMEAHKLLRRVWNRRE